ncbi:MAG: serine hydrolase domain-containing protein [Trueperaceae bacterium]
MRILLMLLLLGFVQAQTVNDVVTMKDVVKQFEDINPRTDKGGGIVIGYMADGKTEVKVLGNQELNEEIVFEIGSLTKPMTALLLADLVNKGEVTLEDSINTLLPEEARRSEFDAVTLQGLATHTSGLPRLPPNMNSLWMLRNGEDPYGAFSETQLYEGLAKTTVKNTGEQSAYSNYGFGLLGFLLAKSQNKSYEDLLREMIWEPLELSSTYISTEPEGVTVALPLTDRGREGDRWTFQAPMEGAGAVKSTMSDMLRFLGACLEESPITENLTLATQPYFKLSEFDDVGLAWVISKQNNQTVVWHNGETGGYAAFLGFNPNTKQGIVILSNLTIGDDLPKRGVNFLLGQPITTEVTAE